MRKKLKWLLVLLALQIAGEQWQPASAAGSSKGGTAYKRDANYKSISK